MKLSKLMVIFVTAISLNLFLPNMLSAKSITPTIALEEFMQQQRGKVIYLDFWASWCVPCRKSFPWMNQMQEKYEKQGFVVVSINLDANQALAKQFLQEVTADFAIIYDNKGVLAKKFQLKGMPSSYLFNRDGQLISAHNGFNDNKKQIFEQEIVQALK